MAAIHKQVGKAMSPQPEVPVRRSLKRDCVEEWELVLAADGLSPKVWRSGDGFVVGVPRGQVERAHAALSAYERENPVEPPDTTEPAGVVHPLIGISVGIALVAFFLIAGMPHPDNPWFEQGAGDARKILHGELWRLVTALTLHSDIAHALANGIALAVFLAALSSSLGAGLAGAMVILTGSTGNLANAWFHGPSHLSIGASTAVFGAVGLLGSLAAMRRDRDRRRRRPILLPLGASVALLAMLGTGGPRIDFWSHFFGLLAGGVLGIVTARFSLGLTRPVVQWVAGGGSLVTLATSWSLAFR